MTSRSYVCPRAQLMPYTMNKTFENIMPLLRKLFFLRSCQPLLSYSTFQFWLIRSLADPTYTSSIFVHGPLHSYCRYFRLWTVDRGRFVMLRLFFHVVWPCFLRQIVWLSSSSLGNSGMIFSNVLFIVYGISCARGQTYDLEVISGV